MYLAHWAEADRSRQVHLTLLGRGGEWPGGRGVLDEHQRFLPQKNDFYTEIRRNGCF